MGGSGFDENPVLIDSVLIIVYRRTVAHELGHAIDIEEHSPHQYDGDNYMCVMLNEMDHLYYIFRPEQNYWSWALWRDTWADRPNQLNHKWGYYNDSANGCQDERCYRP